MKIQKLSRLFCLILVSALQLNSNKVFSEPPKVFNNPGGMWMPHQIKEQQRLLERLGSQIDPELFTSPSSELLQAIVSLGYCSASFVSPTGLILTNHHCIKRILNNLSTRHAVDPKNMPADFNENGLKSELIGRNFFDDGYYAEELKDELPAAANQRVFVTESFEDITELILAGTKSLKDPTQIQKEINKAIALIEDDEDIENGKRFKVISFYRGTKFYLLKQFEIRDVRLVFSPPRGVGFFGGDTDNWMYPRHTGDFGIIRAYVGRDGKPAAYSKDNVPFNNPHALKISAAAKKPGDLSIVAGYPGTTNQLNTAAEVARDFDQETPDKIARMKKTDALLAQLAEQHPELASKVASRRGTLANYINKLSRAQKMLTDLAFTQEKQKAEEAFLEWVAQNDPERKFGNLKDDLEELQNRKEAFEAKWKALNKFTSASSLIDLATTYMRLSEEAVKKDSERSLYYRKKNWQNIRDGISGSFVSYDDKIDIALLSAAVKEIFANDPSNSLLTTLFEAEKINEEGYIETTVASWFNSQSLATLEARIDLYIGATTNDEFAQTLENHEHPIFNVALQLQEQLQQNRQESLALKGSALDTNSRYIAALEAYLASQGKLLAPDANSTLRITFGLITGKRLQDGTFLPPFTYLDEMLAKHQAGSEEFDIPKEVIAAAAEQNQSRYIDPHTGKVPVNGITNVHITNGNSGSPWLNAFGHLAGLLFDGEATSMYSDYTFGSGVRAIYMDSRFMLWLLEEVYNTRRILDEMTIVEGTPEIIGASCERSLAPPASQQTETNILPVSNPPTNIQPGPGSGML